MSLGLFGILVSLGLLMYLAYRGINVLILAPILAIIIVAGYGFLVWIWQMIVGPPGPPPP